jgi:hypothetical protein
MKSINTLHGKSGVAEYEGAWYMLLPLCLDGIKHIMYANLKDELLIGC